MKAIKPTNILCAIVAVVVSAASVSAQTFQFLLSGSQATTNSTATGSAGWASANLAGNILTYTAHFEGFSSLNAAHFHGPAEVGMTAGVLAGISTGGDFSPVSGSVVLTEDQVTALLDGEFYLNFHTPENSGGEIRGQVVQQLDFTPNVLLSGSQETGGVESLGAGAARVVFNTDTGELSWMVAYEGIATGVTGMHFHGPAEPGTDAGVKVNIGATSGLESGTSGSVVLADENDIEDLLNGLWYLNIHSEAHGSGEIRGQVEPIVVSEDEPEEEEYIFLLSGSQATTLETQTGSAGWAKVSLSGDTLTYSAHLDGVSALNAAHFHGPAVSGEPAGVAVGIEIGVDLSLLSGSVTLDAEARTDLKLGNYYLNVHTPENPGGEIRGQVVAQLDFTPNVLLSGSQETGGVESEGAGAARVVFNTETGELSWMVAYEGIATGVTGMHFHGPAEPGTDAGVKVNIGATSGLESGTSGSVVLTDENDIEDLLDGLWYLNIHSEAHGSGEIRGQVHPMVIPGEEPSTLPWEGKASGELAFSSWFGSFVASVNGWLRHSEQGWLFVDYVTTSANMWIYSHSRAAWCWSSESVYPFVYNSASGEWEYFFVVEGSGVFVYLFSASQWTLHP